MTTTTAIAPGALLLLGFAGIAAFGLLLHGKSRPRNSRFAVGGLVCAVLLFAMLALPGKRHRGGGAHVAVARATHAMEVKGEVSVSREPDRSKMRDDESQPPSSPNRSDERTALLRFGGLLALLSLTGLFLDADRRGRYTGLVRVGSAAAFVVVCVFIVTQAAPRGGL